MDAQDTQRKNVCCYEAQIDRLKARSCELLASDEGMAITREILQLEAALAVAMADEHDAACPFMNGDITAEEMDALSEKVETAKTAYEDSLKRFKALTKTVNDEIAAVKIEMTKNEIIKIAEKFRIPLEADDLDLIDSLMGSGSALSVPPKDRGLDDLIAFGPFSAPPMREFDMFSMPPMPAGFNPMPSALPFDLFDPPMMDEYEDEYPSNGNGAEHKKPRKFLGIFTKR